VEGPAGGRCGGRAYNAALIGIVAVGMTYVLIAGEVDLSVGSVFGFLTVIMAQVGSSTGSSIARISRPLGSQHATFQAAGRVRQ
jgi:ribose/xylose/arabinose/galactoside ABC-type transport system permease subunit